MKVITRSMYNRMFQERRCFACDAEIPLDDGHHWRQLGVFVHGKCNARVRAAVRAGRPIHEILAEVRGDPTWLTGR